MSYILNSDKSENFECKLCLEGADLQESEARLVINAKGINLLFEGEISEDGKCIVEVSGLKKVFPKETEGHMKLEVIAEGDTYFLPWEEDVIIKPSKQVKVETVSVGNKKPRKPKMKVEVKQPSVDHVEVLLSKIRKQGLTKSKLTENRKKYLPEIAKCIISYYKSVNQKPKDGLIKEIVRKL
jgi:hypothetical protein